MGPTAFILAVVALTTILITGCASVDSGAPARFAGISGPVAWEVVDIGRTEVPGEGIRWDYTLVLKGTGIGVTFETLETGAEGPRVTGGGHTEAFPHRLEPQGRLVLNGSESVVWGSGGGPSFGDQVPGGREGMRIFYRLAGTDDRGGPVRIDVRFALDPAVGASPAASGAAPGRSRSSSGPGRPPGFAHERLSARPTALEEALLADLGDGRLDRHSRLDAALIVSGARDGAELERLRRRFEEAMAPILRQLAGVSAPTERAAALLLLLHPSRSSRAPVLREYAVDATTLIDVLETGRYNCVSATIAFLLLAERADLEAGAVLLPSHARAVVRDGQRRFPVETTSALGFDPGEAELREVQRRFQPESEAVALYSDEQGSDVDFLALLGAIYVNVSTVRVVGGETVSAEALAGRSTALVSPAARPALNRIRVGLLNELAIEKLGMKRHEEAMATLEEAGRLVADETTRRLVTTNLTAVAYRHLEAIAPTAEEATILALPDRFAEWPAVRAEMRAFALTLVARRRSGAGQWERAVEAFREAARATHIPGQRELIGRELADSELRRIDALAEADPEEAWRAYLALERVDEDEHLRGVRRAVTHRLVVRRMNRLAEQERCEELEPTLALWRDLDSEARPDPVLAGCYASRGVRLWQGGQPDRAAGELRRAHRLAPHELAVRDNLVGVLRVLVDAKIREGRCVEARPVLSEALALAPDDTWLRHAAATCRPATP